MEEECDVKLVNIASCGLHIVHNAYKAGSKATSWEVAHFLSALHTLFDDVPTKREDFTVATSSCLFPLPFCYHRWVENLNVADRTIPMIIIILIIHIYIAHYSHCALMRFLKKQLYPY